MDEIMNGLAAHEDFASDLRDVDKELDEAAIDALRQSRISDLLIESLHKADTWEANRGAATSGLLRIGYRLEKLIARHLDAATDPIKNLSQCAYALESYFKSMRQADRFAQLENRRIDERGRQNNRKPK